jgi:hypothetical protein
MLNSIRGSTVTAYAQRVSSAPANANEVWYMTQPGPYLMIHTPEPPPLESTKEDSF